MNLNYFSEQSKLPLVVSPAEGESGKNNLINWISANKVTIEEKLIESGAMFYSRALIYKRRRILKMWPKR
jgi:hypothetical protein